MSDSVDATNSATELGTDMPLNELEATLFACMNGSISREEFLNNFVNAAVYIMVDGEPAGDTLGDRKPLVIANSLMEPRLLAVFSAPSRADKMREMFADYNFPVMVNTRWALNCIGPHMGIAFNPGCHFGFEIAPEGAQQLKEAIASAENTQQ